MYKWCSVITINFNDSIGLDRTLRSISLQDSELYELIVIDGNSCDDSMTITKKYKDVIDVVISEPDNGIYDAMNKGLRLSNGEYVIFLNSGDSFYSPDVLSCAYKYINPIVLKPCMAYGDTEEVEQSGRTYIKPAKNAKYVWSTTPTRQQSIFYLGKLARSIEFNDEYRIVGDVGFTYRIARDFPEYASPLMLDFVVSKFFQGGVSHKNHIKALRENYRLRKNDMKMNIFLSAIVAIFRMVVRFKSNIL